MHPGSFCQCDFSLYNNSGMCVLTSKIWGLMLLQLLWWGWTHVCKIPKFWLDNLPHYDWCMSSDNNCSNVNIGEVRDMALFLGLSKSYHIYNIGGRMLDLALTNVSDICVAKSSKIRENIWPVNIYHPPLEICMCNVKPISIVKKVENTRNF